MIRISAAPRGVIYLRVAIGVLAGVFTSYVNAADPAVPTVATGSLERLQVQPSNGLPSRWVDVWLPPGYDPDASYPVIYMQDGQALFDAETTWNGQEWGVDETLGAMIETGEVPPTIVVGVWNAGPAHRHPEYFPQRPFESLPVEVQAALLAEGRGEDGPDLFSGKVRSDRYLSFLVQDLIPLIESRYPVRADRSARFVMGSSMGGMISIYAVCEYPGVFGGAACLSTHWPGIFRNDDNPIPGAFIAYLESCLPPPNQHRLYFDRGDATLDALYPPHQTRVDQLMESRNFDQDHWMSKTFPGADHSENAWQARLAIPLRFLLQPHSPTE